MKIDELILYNNTECRDNLVRIEQLMDGTAADPQEARKTAASCIGEILSVSEEMGFK